MRLECQYSEPEIERSQSERKEGEGRALAGSRLDEAQSLFVDKRSDYECWKGKECQGHENIEVQNEVGEVKVPGGCSVEVWSSFRATEDVVPNDVPRNDRQPSICYAVEENDGNLGRDE